MAETLIPQGVAVNPVNGLRVRLGHNIESISANKTLTNQDAQFQLLDPDAALNLNLPDPASSQGSFFWVRNDAPEGNDFVLAVYVWDPDTDAYVDTEEEIEEEATVWLVCDGSTWESLG